MTALGPEQNANHDGLDIPCSEITVLTIIILTFLGFCLLRTSSMSLEN